MLNTTASLSVAPVSSASTTLLAAAAATAGENSLPHDDNNSGNRNDSSERPRGNNTDIINSRSRQTTQTTSSAVALELRDGKVIWRAGHELWLAVAGAEDLPSQGYSRDERVNEAARRGGSSSPAEHSSTSTNRPRGCNGDPPNGSARFNAPRGSARYDFVIIWPTATTAAAATANVSGQENLDATALVATTPSGNKYGNGIQNEESSGTGEGDARRYSDNGSHSISSTHDTDEAAEVGSAATAAGEGDTGPDLGLVEGNSRALGAAGGHVVGELRPLHEFSAERQAALDEV